MSRPARYGEGMDYLTQPIDPTSENDLAVGGLRLTLVDTADPAAFDGWIRADFRGFHGERPKDEVLEEARGYLGGRRTTGVYDDAIPAREPVGTVRNGQNARNSSATSATTTSIPISRALP